MSRYVFISLALITGCTDQVELSLDLDGSLAGASRVEITVLEGACGTLTIADAVAPAPPDRLVAAQSVERDVQPSPIALEDGAYCVIALARSDDCTPVAFGFEDVSAEGRSDRKITIALTTPDPTSDPCPGDFSCDGAGRCAASDPMDASVDAGIRDAGSTDSSCTPLVRECRDGAICATECSAEFGCSYGLWNEFINGSNSCRFVTRFDSNPTQIDASVGPPLLSVENSLVFPCLWRCVESGMSVGADNITEACASCCANRLTNEACSSPIAQAATCIAVVCLPYCISGGECGECVTGDHEQVTDGPTASAVEACVIEFESATGVPWTVNIATTTFM